MSNTGQLKNDQLFKGLTRPAMFLGVSFNFMLINMTLSMCAYTLASDLLVLLVSGPSLHIIGYIICFKEPLFIELLMVKSQKCTKCTNRMYHNANSYDVS